MRGALRNSCRRLRSVKKVSWWWLSAVFRQECRNVLHKHGEAFLLKITAPNALYLLSVTHWLLQAFPSCTQLEGDSQRRPSRTEGWTNPGDEERKWEEANQEFILHFLSLEYCVNLPYQHMSGNRNVKGRHCSLFLLLHNASTTVLDMFQVYSQFTIS